MTHVGIDMHWYNMTLVALNDKGEKVKEDKISCSPQQLDTFFSGLDRPIQAAVECTSNWYWLADWCEQENVSLMLAHSKMVKAISYAKVKTDSVDARTLAELLRVDLLPQAWMASKPRRELRELTRARLRLIQRRNMIQNQIKSVCAKYNRSINELGWYHLNRLDEFFAAHLPASGQIEARLGLEQLSQLQTHIRHIEGAIEQKETFSPTLADLLEVPGIGKVNGWTILAETGDITRFPTDRQYASYCRLVPGSNDSGGKRRHKSGSKDGNRYLKMAYMNAAVSAYRHHSAVRKHFTRMKKRKGPKIARAVVAKQLSKIVWHILSRGEPYRGYKGQMTRSTHAGWPQPINPALLQGRKSPSF